MTSRRKFSLVTLEKVRARAESDARSHGYYLHPDKDFLKDLLEGLKRNEERYGYPACPCRLASGKFEFDRDIICPCDYRDPDVEEYGACYCALYVRKDVFKGEHPVQSVPERRPPEKEARSYTMEEHATVNEKSPVIKRRLWYCKQCGYVVFREEPPYICPICKAKREMFATIKVLTEVLGQ
jgi:ferredoxin-thioredoxin reductase catalytic subunit